MQYSGHIKLYDRYIKVKKLMIKTDYSFISELFIPYPKGFRDTTSQLDDFFKCLIGIIPNNIKQYVIVNNKEAVNEIKSCYSNKNIDLILIDGFNEIWLRDILGLNSTTNKLFLPQYQPDYCNYIYTKDYLKTIKNQVLEIINKTIKKEIIDLPIIFDGGNFVTNGEICFITDKVLKDNSIDADFLNKLFVDYLNIKPIIVNSNPNDKLSHTDGYLNFLNKESICLSSYPSGLEFLKKDILYLNALKETILDNQLNTITIYDRPIDEIVLGGGLVESDKSKSCLSSARGVFINFLILNDTIILPEFTIPSYKKEMDYNLVNKITLQSLGYNVITINCDSLAKLGGCLHCCSFTN